MKVLVIGSGGREHTLTYYLSKSPLCTEIFAAQGNPGIFQIAKKADINPNNFDEVVQICLNKKIDLVIIGPEKPLEAGLSDKLREYSINVFGPSKQAALIESSKAFAKEFMKKNKIPTASYEIFNKNQIDDAIQYIRTQEHPVVIKADGLAAGKGVIIPKSIDESIKTIRDIFDGLFGSSGETVVIEEFLNGDEASIFAITDGDEYITLAPSQDHKRIFDDDKGPNTGGMGAYAPTDLINDVIMDKINVQIFTQAINGLRNNGTPFIGCLYAGLMIKDNQPYVVEFNARFGDPETQAVLTVFEGDLLKLLYSAATGKLDKSAVTNISNGFSCCVVLASDGYPEHYQTGFPIFGLEHIDDKNTMIFHSGTSIINNQLVTAGGRVLCVTTLADSLKEAIDKTYSVINKIKFNNMIYRNDIGQKGLKYIKKK